VGWSEGASCSSVKATLTLSGPGLKPYRCTLATKLYCLTGTGLHVQFKFWLTEC